MYITEECSKKIKYLISYPIDKILVWSKLKEFTDDIIKRLRKFDIVSGKIKNILGKGEKCWFPAFSPLPTMFSKAFFLRIKKKNGIV